MTTGCVSEAAPDRGWSSASGRRAPALAGLLLFLLAADSPAQDTSLEFRQGTHGLRGILKDMELEPLTDLSQLADQPERKLLIVLGETDVVDHLPGGVEQFLRSGGAVLIATDRPNHGAWQSFLGVRIGQASVTSPAGPSYQGLRDCPVVVGTERGRVILDGLEVATNRPRLLEVGVNRLPVLGRFADGSTFDGLDARVSRFVRVILPFAAGGDVGAGRVLVLSDHSVFINDMLLREDNDNIAFTYNSLNWLTDHGQRSQVLLYEEGEAQVNFDIPLRDLPAPPLPPVEELVPWLNRLLAEMQQENLFNRALLGLAPRQAWLRMLALSATLSLVGYGLYRLLRARHRIDPHAPLFGPSVLELAPAGGVVEQRQLAMIQDRNLFEAARDLARHTLAKLGHDPAAAAHGRESAPRPRVHGNYWQRWTLSRLVRRLWKLAYDSPPVRVSPAEFELLLRQLDRVQSAEQKGILRLEFADVNGEKLGRK
jgi:hypothetical protein